MISNNAATAKCANISSFVEEMFANMLDCLVHIVP